jgi:hypothetical protein
MSDKENSSVALVRAVMEKKALDEAAERTAAQVKIDRETERVRTLWAPLLRELEVVAAGFQPRVRVALLPTGSPHLSLFNECGTCSEFCFNDFHRELTGQKLFSMERMGTRKLAGYPGPSVLDARSPEELLAKVLEYIGNNI